MMALYMPMQPSSNTPMIAFSALNRRANSLPVAMASANSWASSLLGWNSRTWDVSCLTLPLASQRRSSRRNGLSSNVSLHSEENAMPARVMEPLRLSIPTRPGHVPLQLATVRIGPSCVSRPWRIWWLYCQAASATTSGASLGMRRNTSMPCFWLSMNPCPFSGSNGCARCTCPALVLDGGDHLRLHRGLRLLAFLVGGETLVAVGDEVNGVHGMDGEVLIASAYATVRNAKTRICEFFRQSASRSLSTA